jgi:multiple sugar transport system permease protein
LHDNGNSSDPAVREGRRRGGRRRSVRRDGRAAVLFAGPSLIGLAVFTVFPIVMSLATGFFNWPAIGERSFVGLENYTALLEDPNFRRVVFNTLLFAVLYVPLNVVVSLALAVWLSPRIRGRQFFRVLFFLPVVAPMVANVIVWRLIYQPNGLIDAIVNSVSGAHAPNFLGDPRWAMIALVAMSVWQGFGYNMLVLSAALDVVPQSLIEAALIDGAGPWRRFFYVTLPMISPAMFFVTTIGLTTGLQTFVQPFLMTGGGPGLATETLVLFIYNQGFSVLQLGVASAAAWVLFIIVLGVTALHFAGQRKWVHYDV